MKIIETDKYELFKIFSYNRIVKQRKIEKLKKSMIQYGFLLPILITTNYFIIDGQNRFYSAKELGIKIKCIMMEDIKDEQIPILIADLNTSAKNWELEDYFNMWCILQYDEYIYLLKLKEKYDIKMSVFFHIILRALKVKKIRDTFKNGTLELSVGMKEKIINVLEFITTIKNISEYTKELSKHNSFMNALINLVKHKDFKDKYFIKKIMNHLGELKRCTSMPEYIFLFERIYNYGKKHRIIFSKTGN